MSFVLPRNVPRLTFSGSVEAVGGRERDQSSPSASPGHRAPASAGSQGRRPLRSEPRGPSLHAGSSSNGRAQASSLAPPLRERMDSVDDELATVALQRAQIEVARGAGAKAAAQRSPMPVFNFREAVVRPEPLLVPLSRRPSSERSPLLAVMWVLASLLAAMGSYQYAPQIVDSVRDATRALSDR